VQCGSRSNDLKSGAGFPAPDELPERRDLDATSTFVEVALPEYTIGKDGKERPARRASTRGFGIII
jgi:hypothetical protein